MKQRTLPLAALTCLTLLVTAGAATAQTIRPEKTLYVQPRIGLSHYLGDYNTGLDFGFGVDGKGIPYSVALEIGYQITPAFGISGAYQQADYPGVYGDAWNATGSFFGEERYDYTRRQTVQLMLRYVFGARTARLAPYIQVGAQASTGYSERRSDFEQEEDLTGIGPAVGVGLDYALNDRTSLTFGFATNLVFPDETIDGSPGAGPEAIDNPDDGPSFDALSSLAIGLKFNFRSAFTPVDVLAIDCPPTLETNQQGTFVATTNDEEATQPVEYSWGWGDGSSSAGMLATHSFTSAGSYTVTFTASNSKSTDSETCAVTVNDPPVPAEIVAFNASPNPAERGQTVNFSSNVRGDGTVTYEWNFGDGTTATGPNPTHVYDEDGTYTVTLTVTNEFGTDTRSITMVVDTQDPCDDITELNSVFFSRNSSRLTDEAQTALQENLDVVGQCPNMTIRIEGFAARGERRAQSLSEARANAVEQFYTDAGIAASRLMAVGMGAVGEMTSKKGGGEQFRRTDSIPSNDGTMMEMDDDDDDDDDDMDDN